MTEENTIREYRSLEIYSEHVVLSPLSHACRSIVYRYEGGELCVGIEDETSRAPVDQRLSNDQVVDIVNRLRFRCNEVAALSHSDVLVDAVTGGHYFIIFVTPAKKKERITDDSIDSHRWRKTLLPDRAPDYEDNRISMPYGREFGKIILGPKQYTMDDVPSANIQKFLCDIRESNRVSDSVKNKNDAEILEYYNLIVNGELTYHGVLWLAEKSDEIDELGVKSPSLRFEVYYDDELKFSSFFLSRTFQTPKDFLLAVEEYINMLRCSYEYSRDFPSVDTLSTNCTYRRRMFSNYNPELVREFLIDAYIHDRLSESVEIIIKFYSDHLKISDPYDSSSGRFPTVWFQIARRCDPMMVELLKALLW